MIAVEHATDCGPLERFEPTSKRVDVHGRRHYIIPEIGPHPVPSVTTVLEVTTDLSSSFAFRRWRDQLEAIRPGLADDVRDAAAERGTECHAWLTDHIVNRKDPDPSDTDPWHRSLARLCRQWTTVATVALADGLVWHGPDAFAGACDFALWIASRLGVWDLKSAMRRRSTLELMRAIAQCGGYARGIEWTHGVTVDDCGVVVAIPDEPAQVQMVPASYAMSLWDEHRIEYRRRTGL